MQITDNSKLWVSSSDYVTEKGSIGSLKYEWIEGGDRIYLGDYIEQGNLFYPENEDIAEKLYEIVVNDFSLFIEYDDGTARWKFKPTLAPEWAAAHPEMAAKIRLLSESCLPREICKPTKTEQVTAP